MTYDEALTFIHGISWKFSKPGLSRTAELLSKLGDPQKKLKYVHIAGTNGKGSTAAMCASVLTAAGYRTALYTSPFIGRFNERMQIDGRQIPDETLAELTERCVPVALAMEDRPTEFELVTVIALLWFARSDCEIAVMEVGMGGRLDSTNIIPAPECAVITNIGLDHTEYLGDTVEKIAAEKAAIIKPGCAAVLYAQTPSVQAVVMNAAAEAGAPLSVAGADGLESLSDSREGQRFAWHGGEYALPLLGGHQLKNAAVVLKTVEALRERGWSISDSALRDGLAATVWPARFEILSREPWFVLDGGHNPQCAQTVAANLKCYFPHMRRVLLMGVLRDKDVRAMTDILAPVADEFITVTPASPRAMKAAELAALLGEYGKPVTVCDSIPSGVGAAVSATGDGVACAVGSLYMSGDIRRCFGRE